MKTHLNSETLPSIFRPAMCSSNMMEHSSPMSCPNTSNCSPIFSSTFSSTSASADDWLVVGKSRLLVSKVN